jgi:cysteine desulfurase
MTHESTRIFQLRKYLSQQLAVISKVTVVANEHDHNSRYLSIVFDDFSGEEVLRALMQRGINTDSGSACSPEDLAPSHVLSAMGYPTTGTLRFTLHARHSEEDIDVMANAVSGVLESLRS